MSRLWALGFRLWEGNGVAPLAKLRSSFLKPKAKSLKPILAALAIASAASSTVSAQYANPPVRSESVSQKDGILKQVGIDQKIGQQLPLDLIFKDESGREVRLGEYFNGKPVVMALAYYECPMLCTQVLNGMTAALKTLSFDAGKDFEVVVVSIDPRDGYQMAAAKKATYLEHYGRPASAAGFHFLTGKDASIKPLADALGFHYAYDTNLKQFAHGAAIYVATPHGVVSRYLLGIDFAPRDVRLALVYYECPMLCTQVLNGVVSSLGVVKFNAGTEFDVIAVSINPKEGPGLASQKKQAYVDRYKRPGTEHGFHFLTGRQESIDQLAQAVGFRYEYDAETGQYAHGAGIEILTPKGVISRYFYGIDFSPRDMQFGLMDAAEQRIGSRIDSALLLCYHYDPSTGKYGVIAIDAIRIGGVATVLAFLAFLFVSLRRERAAARQAH